MHAKKQINFTSLHRIPSVRGRDISHAVVILGRCQVIDNPYCSVERLHMWVIKSITNTTQNIIYFVQRMSYRVTHLPRLRE